MASDILLKDYRPRPELVTETHLVNKPLVPVIDGHNHIGSQFGHPWEDRPVKELLDLMDEAGVEVMVDLDGGFGEQYLTKHLGHFKKTAPERFYVFGGVDVFQFAEKGNSFGDWAAAEFRKQCGWGAQGLKVWKSLGLQAKDHTGRLIGVDDHRLDPLWDTAAELKLPVVIHVGDPAAFFRPLEATNERWEELQCHPDWHFQSPPYPPLLEVLEDLRRLVKSHPRTTFIGAHVGCYAENLGWVGRVLDEAPNFYVDLSARLAELGRQPYTAREFFIKYQNRIVFGTDMGMELGVYRNYYRFLETHDEYFNYDTSEVPGQGRWFIYGIKLPPQVLKKVYQENMRRLLPRPEQMSSPAQKV